MVADKGKKLKVSEQIHGDLLLSIEKLQQIQDELEKINDEQTDKVLELEQQYNKVRKPIYEKRNEVLKGIPDFWLTALVSHPGLGDYITEEDQKIFKYLSSIEVEDSKDVKSGYSISFIFNPNPFFENSKLTKTLTFLDEGSMKVTATEIEWKEGMDLPNGVSHEKNGNKRPHPDQSFFNWFAEVQQKDDISEFRDEVAEAIREDLWPNPLTYFSNEFDEIEFDGDEGDEEVLVLVLRHQRITLNKENDSDGEDGNDEEGEDDQDN
ncbi:putative nucleosome assembly protein (NAP) [Heracleum sosnowskyi]|uniref:Nucleosome assembly protein (NAP) n=1 Tax=Heracleum sosnowskyi TaxID=360622 RepID=A0AAD8HV02_9APIA|nr:putative nucleosome assembly protein (NAP) [Heracleum sosnowskyi]